MKKEKRAVSHCTADIDIMFHHMTHLTSSVNRSYPVRKIAEKAVCRVFSTIWHCNLSAALIQIVFLAILPTG